MPSEHGVEKAPKVSVCIPSYNHARYIGSSIKSVLAQTFKDWEMIIVDNCSTDNTEEVLKTFADPRIHFHKNETNIGAARNWSRSASLARGEYVAVLQSDDQYLPGMLERSITMLDTHPRVGFVHSSFHRMDSDGNFIDMQQRWEHDQVIDGLNALRLLTKDCYITPSTVVMRRSLFKDLGGFDVRYQYSIDWSMWMRMALSSDVGYIAEPLVLQRPVHPASLTARSIMRKPRLATSEELRLIDEIFGILPASREWREIRHEAYRNIMYRHIVKALWLLHHGETSPFRSEIAYVIRLNRRFPLQYRKVMALWAASVLGTGFPKWLDYQEQAFWQAFRGQRRREPTVIVP